MKNYSSILTNVLYILLTAIFINCTCNENRYEDDFKTPLHLAANSGNIDEVRKLIKKGAKVNRADKYGWTPLHWAAHAGNTAVVELLINNKANMEAKEKVNGRTPLHLAADTGSINELMHSKRVETVRLLIAKKVNMNATDKYGKTPLDLAKERNYNKETASIIALLENR